jgi:hypothetical protein
VTAWFFWGFSMILSAEQPLELAYQAPAECPDSHAFSADVRTRLQDMGGIEIEDPRIEVTIQRTHGKLRGRVTIGGDGEARRERIVEGRRCRDLASALALVIALSLQERAAAHETETAHRPREPQPTVRAPELVAESRWSLDAGVGMDSAIGMAPDALLAIPVFIETRFRAGRWRPEVRLAVVQTLTDRAQRGPATADFSVRFGEVDLCPTAFVLGLVQIVPCVRMQAGVLSAGGVGLSAQRSEDRPWLAPLVLARGRATIASRFFAQLEIGVGFPLTRDRFMVDPQLVVWEVPATMFAAGAAMGVVFW